MSLVRDRLIHSGVFQHAASFSATCVVIALSRSSETHARPHIRDKKPPPPWGWLHESGEITQDEVPGSPGPDADGKGQMERVRLDEVGEHCSGLVNGSLLLLSSHSPGR
jgi:hypothetical protein